MQALILAAGYGKRLRPLTDITHKSLVEVNGVPLLINTLNCLSGRNVTEVLLIVGDKKHLIIEKIGHQYKDMKITYIENPLYKETNNIYSLWLTRPHTDGEEILLLDSDIVFDPQIVERLLHSDKDDILALNRHELGEEEIKVIVDDAQKVVEISKVCSISDAIGESIGIEKMSTEYTKALFRELETMITTEGLDNIFYERAFERLIPQGYSFYVMDTTQFFSAELDTVEAFKQAQKPIPTSP